MYISVIFKKSFMFIFIMILEYKIIIIFFNVISCYAVVTSSTSVSNKRPASILKNSIHLNAVLPISNQLQHYSTTPLTRQDEYEVVSGFLE